MIAHQLLTLALTTRRIWLGKAYWIMTSCPMLKTRNTFTLESNDCQICFSISQLHEAKLPKQLINSHSNVKTHECPHGSILVQVNIWASKSKKTWRMLEMVNRVIVGNTFTMTLQETQL